MAPELSAERSLDSLAAHSPQAWEELFDFLGPRVWPMLRHMLPDRALAEEVLREAFLRLGQHAELRRRTGRSLAIWFVALTRQLALDRLRRTDNLPASLSAGASPLATTLTWLPRPDALLQIEERMGLLKKIVNQLPKSQQQAVEMAFWEGCPEAEIATRLGMPLAKATTELRAAMSFLRHRLCAVLGIWTANI
jgi:RNA polymerase sigma factor (sigma-70 family)